MGEYADMFIDGTLDLETGEFIDGDSPGYPRRKRQKRKDSNVLPCDHCGKKLKTWQGRADHIKDAHGLPREH